LIDLLLIVLEIQLQLDKRNARLVFFPLPPFKIRQRVVSVRNRA
jgi:hypothetical protein